MHSPKIFIPVLLKLAFVACDNPIKVGWLARPEPQTSVKASMSRVLCIAAAQMGGARRGDAREPTLSERSRANGL
jgi:hypothetical protein